MKKIISVVVLCAVLFTGTTCKKIWKYPISMYGVWTCNHNNCSWMLLEIKKTGSGSYGPGTCCKGCDSHVKGEVRFTKEHLYIGIAKLKFLNKPEKIENNDSLDLAYGYYLGFKKSRILAEMTIRESHLRGGGTYTFYKIKDY